MVKDDTKNENFTLYRGWVLFSFEGAIQWIIIIGSLFALVVGLSQRKWEFFIGITCNALVLLALFMNRVHYFKMSENYLVVKNSTKFWLNHVYRISDIKEVVLEQHPKMPVALRVITKDFKTKLYPAVSLWNKRWRGFRDALKNKNIPIRMECSIGD